MERHVIQALRYGSPGCHIENDAVVSDAGLCHADRGGPQLAHVSIPHQRGLGARRRVLEIAPLGGKSLCSQVADAHLGLARRVRTLAHPLAG